MYVEKSQNNDTMESRRVKAILDKRNTCLIQSCVRVDNDCIPNNGWIASEYDWLVAIHKVDKEARKYVIATQVKWLQVHNLTVIMVK